MSTPAQNIAAIQASLRDLEVSAGPKADAQFTVKGHGECNVYFRPAGWGADTPSIIASGPGFEDCFSDVRRQWEEMSAHVHTETVKKLALAIIRITHELGSCTDAALRPEFDASEVKKYGVEAIGLANTMAERGPFSIVALDGANAS